MDFTRFFPLVAQYMTGDDALKATENIQKGDAAGVVIDCHGGAVKSFSENAVALTNQHFTSLALSIASLAVDYYLCADTRLALPDSTFTIHYPRIETSKNGTQTLEQLFWQHEISRIQAKVRPSAKSKRLARRRLVREILGTAEWQHFGVRWVARRTGLEPGIVDRMMRDEVTLTATEALHYGLVHRIIEL